MMTIVLNEAFLPLVQYKMFVHYKTFLLQMLSQLPQCITQVSIYGNGKFLASCTEIVHVIKIRSNFMIQNGGLENFLISNLSRPLGVFFLI